jgi:hypothetical protein
VLAKPGKTFYHNIIAHLSLIMGKEFWSVTIICIGNVLIEATSFCNIMLDGQSKGKSINLQFNLNKKRII